MDARVGILIRDGKQVYYGFIGGIFGGLIEKNSPEEVVAALDGKVSPSPKKTRARAARVLHVYIVKITVKYPSCDDNGTELEFFGYNAKDAIASARKQVFNYYDRHDGAKTYTARRR